MLFETDLIPYAASPPPGERVFVLAPHPDDESLGCGGAIRLLVEAGRDVRVIFLTSGDKADPAHPSAAKTLGAEHQTEYARIREREAMEALGILGVASFEFLRLPDRGLYQCSAEVLDILAARVAEFVPDTIYSPSPVELNPDHRTTALIALALQERSWNALSGRKEPVRRMSVAFYEVTVPLRPNVLVDISRVFKIKGEAVGKYRSQLCLIDYLRTITSMNAMRTITLGGTGYAEAFWHLDAAWSFQKRHDWLSYIIALGEGGDKNGHRL